MIYLKQNDYIQVTGVIFAVVALLHAWRLLSGMVVVFGGYEIPLWGSVLGLVVAGFLAYSSWKLKK